MLKVLERSENLNLDKDTEPTTLSLFLRFLKCHESTLPDSREPQVTSVSAQGISNPD